jgi:hypothetical protein
MQEAFIACPDINAERASQLRLRRCGGRLHLQPPEQFQSEIVQAERYIGAWGYNKKEHRNNVIQGWQYAQKTIWHPETTRTP